MRLLTITPVLLLISCTSVPKTLPSPEPVHQEENTASMDTFDNNDETGFSGNVTVQGYATISKKNEPFCESDCATYDYVLFTITGDINDGLEKFLDSYRGNSYTGEHQIGIGCLDGDTIRYENDSDELGTVQSSLSPELTQKILHATHDSPVTLQLVKRILTAGRGAPACYSHFSDIELWET